jgi:hypothetical protein
MYIKDQNVHNFMQKYAEFLHLQYEGCETEAEKRCVSNAASAFITALVDTELPFFRERRHDPISTIRLFGIAKLDTTSASWSGEDFLDFVKGRK